MYRCYPNRVESSRAGRIETELVIVKIMSTIVRPFIKLHMYILFTAKLTEIGQRKKQLRMTARYAFNISSDTPKDHD